MDNKNIKPEFIFIHGYTGGPTDFANLPDRVEREFGATTYCPLLPGHGTKIEDLFDLTEDDLLAGIEAHIKAALARGSKVVVIGVSFGAQAALYLATKYPLAGIVALGTTHKFLFPFNIPGIGLLGYMKRTWKKSFTSFEELQRADAVYYNYMLSDGFFISRRLCAKVDAAADRIVCPVFFLHSVQERMGDPSILPTLRQKISGRVDIELIEDDNHSMFFSHKKEYLADTIVAFVKNANIFSDIKEEKATAIVPAYNEGARIGAVLEALSHTPSVGQIIVVDDGSTDNTQTEAARHPAVTYLRNERNIGKAASMERGVRAAKNDVLFFCDADLCDFQPEYAEAIVRPVLHKQYDMYIGMRGNIMQRAVQTWALNSGERALRKEVWNALPAYYKHRYRVEAGLNRLIKSTNRKLGWKKFNYTQPLKEAKYGIVRGTLLRWWMNFDVLCAYASYPLLKRWTKQQTHCAPARNRTSITNSASSRPIR